MGQPSVLEGLPGESRKEEQAVANRFYREYRQLLADLYVHLCEKHPAEPRLELLKSARRIIDRIVFVAFSEDRGLLPRNAIADACTSHEHSRRCPLWENFLELFDRMDRGNETPRAPAYNAGLFREDPFLNRLNLSDDLCRRFAAIARYDFSEEISIKVLGRIFEQSLTDLEALRAQANGDSKPARKSKRRLEGVFYTPDYVTRFIVERAIGPLFAERWAASLARHQPEVRRGKLEQIDAWIDSWEDYGEALQGIRILDPACGAGAFLIAAYDYLHAEYDRVNTALAALGQGQVVVRDVTRTVLNNNLFGVDLNHASVEITRLSLWLKTAEPGRKLTRLDRNIKCGNSIVDDPRVDLRAFDWNRSTATRVLPEAAPEAAGLAGEAPEIDARWREGFDAVIGNPPYVRQEDLAPLKAYLAGAWPEVFHGVADLFVYFFALGMRLLKPGGRLAYIASNSWLRANYACPMRIWLRTHATLETLIDLGDNRVFKDAPDVYPAIVVARNTPPPPNHTADAALFRRGEGIYSFARQVEQKCFRVSIHDQPDPGWQLEGETGRCLLARLLETGRPLSEVVGGQLFYGVKTGLNAAFLVGQDTRNRLVAEDPACAAIIRPILRGEDLRPWYQRDPADWVIFARRGIDINRYPSVRAHLEAFRTRLEPRPRDWPARTPWPGRKSGAYQWYEIQDTVDYFEHFDQPKIFWPELAKQPRFSYDDQGTLVNNKGFFAATRAQWLVGLLNSRACWYIIKNICLNLGERAGLVRYQLFARSLSRLPIPDITPDEAVSLTGLATRIGALARDRYILQQTTVHRIGDLALEGRKANLKLRRWWTLDFRAFRAEVRTAFKRDIPLRERDDWESLVTVRRLEHARLTGEMVSLEAELNERVYRLYSMTKEEIALVEEETRYDYGEV